MFNVTKQSRILNSDNYIAATPKLYCVSPTHSCIINHRVSICIKLNQTLTQTIIAIIPYCDHRITPFR